MPIEPNNSDHNPITTKIIPTRQSKPDAGRTSRHSRIQIKPNLTEAEWSQILNHYDFPRRPAVLIAHSLGLTLTTKIRPPSDFRAMRRFITQKGPALQVIAKYELLRITPESQAIQAF